MTTLLSATVTSGVFAQSAAQTGAPGSKIESPTVGSRARTNFKTALAPLLIKYCTDCHGGEDPKNDISLEFADAQDVERRLRKDYGAFAEIGDGRLVFRRNRTAPASACAGRLRLRVRLPGRGIGRKQRMNRGRQREHGGESNKSGNFCVGHVEAECPALWLQAQSLSSTASCRRNCHSSDNPSTRYRLKMLSILGYNSEKPK